MTKRIIAMLLCALMILSMIPVMAISTSAAADGIWTTYRFASEYDDPDEEPDPNEEPSVYKPEAGYTYTSEGFSIVPADYTDTTPSMSVITKDKQSVKDGIYLQFRIDDYSYDGGTGADQWIALSLSTGPKVAPGSANYGGGWLTLIRGTGNGNSTTLPHLTDPATEDFGGTFNNIGSIAAPVPMDDEGREIYTFEVSHNGTEYEIKVNGVVQPGGTQTSALLDKLDENGDFYVGINIQAGVKNGTAALTILKYGTSEADATTPVGGDEKEPEENQMTIAPIEDPSTVEANKPAILWDPTTVNIKGGNNCTFTVLGDNTWRVNATDAAVFMNFSPKRKWSYAGEDFPIFGIMFRNIWTESGTLWYAAGEVMGAKDGCNFPVSIYDGEFYGEDEEYVFVPWDMTDLWEGRINTIRLDFAMADETLREFDICFAGMFRSEEEAYAYAEEYLKATTDVDPDATKEETEAPTEAPTDAPETNAPETNAPEQGGDATQAPESETDAPKEGCGSVIGFSAVAILAAAAAAVALKKKD
jgi:hypothetical protein